ncbi:hypothetical protein ALP8811_00405 [Aliiroseovarius pelagivivens]|uniref:YdhG-like domain-containing protein n=1 Tax=Aliiroseovarius pelagivivens TaxID=1639690 RepID=A0A2R8AHC1_9RHOB|nr:DUF1801 domain-containing protein [Aliiroseovarius pelagivivens]SPF75418.1 hypothetical protein ALP8811_00405 [Aliiroseovarius pelagivivens]
MAQNKTTPTDLTAENFITSVEPASKQEDAKVLDQLFQSVTGYKPLMWGPSIIGYGQYHYVYDSGRQGDFLATGFSPRKARHSIYIMPGYADFGDILARLGKHKMGKSCLYVNKLADIDLDVLAELIRAGLADLDKKWPIQPT